MIRKGAAFALASDEPDDDSWMMTYLDMMTLLLVVTMALLALASKAHAPTAAMPAAAPLATRVATLGQVVLPQGLALLGRPMPAPEPEPVAPPPVAEPAPQAPPSAEQLLQDMGLAALGKDIEVLHSQAGVSFRLSSELLFGTGQAELSAQGISALQPLLAVLGGNGHQVLVEGHTDAEQMHSPRYPTNWELSSARAASVVRYLQDNGVAGERLRAVGYGEMHPLADNASEAGRARNRRVEIVLQAGSAG